MDSTLIGIVISALIGIVGYIFHLKSSKEKADNRTTEALSKLAFAEATKELVKAQEVAKNAEEEYNKQRSELITYFNNGKPGSGE